MSPPEQVALVRVAPSPPLRPLVQSLWCLDTRAGDGSDQAALMHPDGGTSLILSYGAPLGLASTPGQGLIWAPALPQSGQLLPAAGRYAFGVRFHPAGVRALWDCPVPDINDMLLSARAAAPLHALHEQMALLPDTHSRLAYLDQWLLTHLRPQRPSPAVNGTMQALRAMKPLPEVLADVPLSRRALERRFLMEVGMSPKQFARVARVASARRLLKQPLPQRPSQAWLAQQLGYFDEAHFIRDFQRVVGLTPGRYARRQSS